MRNLLLAAASVLTLALAAPAIAQETRVLDSMDDATRWEASASTDVHAAVSAVAGHDGKAVRLDYDFDGKAGYAVLSRPLPFDLPDNYEISFWVRGAGPTNTFEVKLTDASADNVWWKQTARYDFPDGWTRFVIKRRQVSKAWGPRHWTCVCPRCPRAAASGWCCVSLIRSRARCRWRSWACHLR